MFGNLRERQCQSKHIIWLMMVVLGVIALASSLLAFTHKQRVYALTASTWDGVSVATQFTGGDGTVNDPYIISSASELALFMGASSDANAHYLLTSDIDWNGNNWSYAQEFTGSFDGGRHTIGNIASISVTNETLGFFNSVNNATIRNLFLDFNSATISAYASKVGILVGSATNSNIYNCAVRNVVLNTRLTSLATDTNTFTGGLVGYADATDISNSSFTGSIYNSALNSNVGGLVGYMSAGSIKDCFVIAENISASATYVQPDADTKTYAQVASGLIGTRVGADVQRVYISANITATHTYTGSDGVVNKATGTVYAVSQSQGTTEGAFYNSDKIFSSSGTVNTVVGTAKTSAELIQSVTYDTWASTGTTFATNWVIDSALNAGYPVQRAAYGREIKVSKILQDAKGNTITTTDENWAKIATTGSGMYLSPDMGASVGETANIGLVFDGISNEQDIGYAFQGYVYKGAKISTDRSLSIEVSSATEGDYYAVFTETIITPLVNIRVYDRHSGKYNVHYGLSDITTLDKSAENFTIGDDYTYTFNFSTVLYQFEGWQVNGETLLTEGNVANLVNGEITGTFGNVLTGTIGSNYIETYKVNTNIEISVLLKPSTFTLNITKVGTKPGDGQLNTDKASMQVGDRLNIRATTSNNEVGVVSIKYQSNVKVDEAYTYTNIFTTESVLNEVNVYFDLTENVVKDALLTTVAGDYLMQVEVDFREVLSVTTSGMIDDGKFTKLFTDKVSPKVSVNGEDYYSELKAYQGQTIYLKYTNLEGVELVKFTKKVETVGGTSYEDLFGGAIGEGASMTVEEDICIVAMYYRTAYNYFVKYYNSSTQQSLDATELINLTVTSDFVESIDETTGNITYSTNKHYDQVSLTARLLDEKFKFVGFKWVDEGGKVEDATLVKEPNTASIIEYIFTVTEECHEKTLYLVYNQLNMSLDFISGVMGEAVTIYDVPAELVVYQDGEALPTLSLRDIVKGKTLVLTAKTKLGYTFAGWYKDGSLITTDANAGYDAADNLYTPVATEGVNTFVITSFKTELSGIYAARYTKLQYTINIDNSAGNTVLRSSTQTNNNTIQAYVEQMIRVSYLPVENKKILGLTTQVGGEILYTDNILVTSDLLETADASRILRLYQVYEDRYQLTINNSDVTNCPMSMTVNGAVYSYSGATYFDKDSSITITLVPAKNYHYTITGLDEKSLTADGATFTLTADTIINIDVALDTYVVTITTEAGYESAGTFVGADTYSYGTKAQISVTAKEGYKFEKWQKKVGEVYIDHEFSPNFAHIVEGDIEFRAIFIELYVITTSVSTTDGGNITPSFTLTKNSTASIEVTVNEGYYIKAWYLNSEEMSGMANVSRLVINGKANEAYHVELALIQYIFNLDQLNDIYGTGYTITEPENEEFYVFGETVHFVLTDVVKPIRLNAVYANMIQQISSAHVTDEHKTEFSITIDNTLFVNNVCDITLDYTFIYSVNVKRNQAEGNMPTINSLSYISRLENSEDGITYYTYHILDGTTITLNTSNNEKYLFRAYYILNESDEYVLYSNNYESDILISADTTILTDYIGVEYKIDYTYYVLDEDEEVIVGFPVEYLSTPIYTYTYNGTTDTTSILRYGDKIDIAMSSAPYGTTLHHFVSGATNTTNIITVDMNMTSNIAVAVYLTRDELTVNIDGISATNSIKVDGMEVLTVSGHGSYYIGDKVELVLTNKISSYFEVKGWKLNSTELNFIARKAGYEKMTLQTYSGYLKLSFIIIPFDDTNTMTFSPIVSYKLFKVSSTVYVDGQKDTNANPVATTRVSVIRGGSPIVDSSDPSVNTLVRYKDKVIITFVFNTDYVDQYEFSGLTLGGIKLADPQQTGNEYTYIIESFETSNKGDYRVKFLSKLSNIYLETNLERAIQDGALVKNKATYAIDDLVRIEVIVNKITPGYSFQGWYDSTTLLTKDYVYTFTFDASHSGKTFTATFQAINYNIEICSSANGGVYKQISEEGEGIDSLIGSAQYNAETGLTMYFVPDVSNGYHLEKLEYGIYNEGVEYSPIDAVGLYTEDSETLIAEWILDFGIVAGLINNPEDYIFVISATYDLRKYNIIVSTTLDGVAYTGDALLEYDINAQGELRNLIVTHGTNINIVFDNVVYGYILAGVSFDYGEISNVDLTYTVASVTNAGELVIRIERERFEVTVTTNNSMFGSVSGSGQYAIGDVVEFRATVLGSGYEFVGFSHEGNLVSTDLTYSFTFDVMEGGNYDYVAEFKVRAIYLYAFAYKQVGAKYEPITDDDGNPYNALTFQIESQYETSGYFDFGTTVTSYFREIEGYTCTRTYIKDCLVQSLSFNITENLIKNMDEGSYEIKVIYTVDTYTVKLCSNFSEIYDLAKPADLTYKTTGSRRSERTINAEYNTTMYIYLNNLKSNYLFDGFYENGKLLDEVTYNTLKQGYKYTVKKDVVLLIHYTPLIKFDHLTNPEQRLYESMYTSTEQGINVKDHIKNVDEKLQPYIVINYNGSSAKPINVGSYEITVTFSNEALRDISITGATFVITPVELSFSFTGTVSKMYDGTATITDFSGLKFTDNLIQENDKAYITLDTTNTTARFVYKVNGVNYDQTKVGTGYTIEFSGIQLSVNVLQYESKLNNYVLTNNGQVEFNNVGSIVKKRISLEGIYLTSKVFDDSTKVVFANNYTIYDSYLNPSEIVSVGGVADNIAVDYENIEYKFISKEVSANVIARGNIKSGTGLLGAKANNYELVLPDYTGFTIHPYQLTAKGSYGTITITDIKRNLYLPLDLTISVEVVDTMSDSYRLIYSAVEPKLVGNKNFETAYTIKLLRNGFEYYINGSVVVDISTPTSVNNAKITNVLHYGETVNDMSITADSENIMFMTGMLGTFVLVSQSNPVPLWVIILVSVILLLIIITLCIYFFVILPKKREKAYAKFNQI